MAYNGQEQLEKKKGGDSKPASERCCKLNRKVTDYRWPGKIYYCTFEKCRIKKSNVGGVPGEAGEKTDKFLVRRIKNMYA